MNRVSGPALRSLLAFGAAVLLVQPAAANIGRVKVASGNAHIERAGARVEIKPGFILEQGDTLITPAKSRIGITFVDNTRISAAPDSRIHIRTFEYNDTTEEGRIQADLLRGSMAVMSGNIPRSGLRAMEVSTKRNIFAIRGARAVIRAK